MAIVTGAVNNKSLDFSHFKTLPVFPVKARFAGFVPEQIVCAEDTVPPTVSGSTVTIVYEDETFGQTPFFTTALNRVVWLNAPDV